MKSESLKPRTMPRPSGEDETGFSEAEEGNGSRIAAIARIGDKPAPRDDRLERLARETLAELGEDPGREGLLNTPGRMAKALRYLTSGSELDPSSVLNGALFDAGGYDEMVLVKEIEFYSLCEHHLLPFFGNVTIAYLPQGKVAGLSKLPRLVDLFARRLQLQERMTRQIAQAIQEIAEPRGVAVSATGFHLCMAMRGVSKQQSVTTTRAFTGEFLSNPSLRAEFLSETAGARRHAAEAAPR